MLETKNPIIYLHISAELIHKFNIQISFSIEIEEQTQ